MNTVCRSLDEGSPCENSEDAVRNGSSAGRAAGAEAPSAPPGDGRSGGNQCGTAPASCRREHGHRLRLSPYLAF